VAGRQHEAVAPDPRGVGGVVAQDVLVEKVSGGRQRDRGAGMTVTGLLDGVGGEHAHGVHGALVQLGPALRGLEVLGHRYVPSVGSGTPLGVMLT